MDELKSGTLPEPVELASGELTFVGGGQALSFVNQLNDARVFIGKHDKVVTSLSFVADVVVSPPVVPSA